MKKIKEIQLTYFNKGEKEYIIKWMKRNNYNYWTPTVLCGDYCGIYHDRVCAGGIFGDWRNEKDKNRFIKSAQKKGFHFIVSGCDIWNVDADDWAISTDAIRF